MTIQEMQRDRLKQLLIAESRVLVNQSYTIGDRVYVRPDLEKIQQEINALINAGVSLDDEPVGRRQTRAVFID